MRVSLGKRHALILALLLGGVTLLAAGASGLIPAGRYMVPQIDGEPVRIEAEVPGGIRYVVWPGVDVFGREVVLAHVVERSSAATAVVDLRFVREIDDGRTALGQALQLMKSIAGGQWGSRGMRDAELLVPGYLWGSLDGSGRLTVAYFELSPTERSKMTDLGMEQDAYTFNWPRSRVDTMPPALYEEMGW